MRLTLTSPALIAADTETRELKGVAIPYGVYGNTSIGRVCVDAGAVNVQENLRAIKLFSEHGRQTPTGYAVEATDSAEQLFTRFSVARTPDGDRALLEASEGVRDALSVELDNVTIEAGHVIAADLVAVAQVALPAFAGAQLVATLSDDDQAKANDLAQQLVDLTAPEEPTEETPPAESEATAMTQTTEASAAPAALSMTPSTPARRDHLHPGNDRHLWAAAASEALRGASDAAQVNAALNDITPTSAATGEAFPRPVWIDQLWQPAAKARPLVNAIGVKPLTGMVMEGWKWTTSPVVSPYAGEKTAIPSSPAVIAPASATAQRIAGGWDLDRIYVDLSTGFLEAFQTAAIKDYVKKSSTYLIDGHTAITGPPAIPAVTGIAADAKDLGTKASPMEAISACVAYLVGTGANVSFVAMASDVFGSFLKMTGAAAPWWLQQQGSVSLNGVADVASTAIMVDPGLPNGQVLAGDRDAVSLWETGPIQVNAINLPNGGIDFALFGYYAHLVHDDDGLVKAQATLTLLAADDQSAPREEEVSPGGRMAERTIGGRVAETYAPTWLAPADVAGWLRMNAPGAGTPDGAELDRVCAATQVYVERCRPEFWFVDDLDPEEVVYEPDSETYQGAVMYAAREVRRRNSPSGVETAIDGNPVFVSRYDSDIERALRTGTWNKPGVG